MITFELSKTIKYSNGSGAEVECSFIELREPTGKVSNTVCAIEGIIQSSLMKMADMFKDIIDDAKDAPAKNDDEEKKDGAAMYGMIAGSGADMNKVVLHFRELFREVAWMGGEKQITAPRLDDLSHKDFKKMIGVYAANFIMD